MNTLLLPDIEYRPLVRWSAGLAAAVGTLLTAREKTGRWRAKFNSYKLLQASAAV